MRPATAPRPPAAGRLLRIDPSRGAFWDYRMADLPGLLRKGDVLVVNDAATLPASLRGRAPSGAEVELRLLGRAGSLRWRAVVLGAGDWRTRTEDRPAPGSLAPGDRVALGPGLSAIVEATSPISNRLVDVRFEAPGDSFWPALYEAGRVVQYAHLTDPLSLQDVQTAYASRPWAAEIPSAGRALSWQLLLEMRKRGVILRGLTHAAGLSSTGDPAVDAELPLPEAFEIPPETASAVGGARASGGRVVAVGTTVVRALEGAARQGLPSGRGETSLKLRKGSPRLVVDGLLTGLHEEGSSHLELLEAFVPGDLLRAAYAHASAEGYLGHEFGDSSLILEDPDAEAGLDGRGAS